jgi:hypothetical protein
MLDRKICVDLSVKNPATVGKPNMADQSKNPTIALCGTGIQEQHAALVFNT